MQGQDTIAFPAHDRRWSWAAAVAGVAALAFLAALAARDSAEVGRLVLHARAVEHEARTLKSLLLALQRAEAGQRGFVLTGESRYLDTYDEGVGDVHQWLGSQAREVSGQGVPPVDTALVNEVTRKLEEMSDTVRLRADESFDNARALVLTDLGRESMRRIRGALEGRESDLYARLESHRDTLIERNHALRTKMIVGSGLVAALLGLAVLLAMKSERRRRAAESEVVQAREALMHAHQDLARRNAAFVKAMDETAYRVHWPDGSIEWTGASSGAVGVPLDRAAPHLAAWKAFVHAEDRARYEAELDRCAADTGLLDIVYRVRHDGGDWRWVHDRAVLSRDARGAPLDLVGVLRDVTEQWSLQRERDRLVVRLETLLGSIRDGFAALDAAWRFVYANAQAAERLGVPRAAMIGHSVWQLMPVLEGTPFQAACVRVRGGQVSESVELHLADSGRWLLIHLYATDDGLSLFIEDVTVRKRIEIERDESRARLQSFATLLERTVEEERSRIAREIHDVLGQAFSSLKLDVGWLRRRLAGLPADSAAAGPLFDRLDAMDGFLDESVVVARRLARELRPAVLDDLGLAAALRDAVTDLARRAGVDCELDLDEVTVPPAVQTALFRIALEACGNALRHGAPTLLRVALEAGDGVVRLRVQDDGSGFVPGDDRASGHLGLLGITERAMLAGGEAEILSAPDAGTTVRVTVPLPAFPEAASRTADA